jgi:hypothetical protein
MNNHMKKNRIWIEGAILSLIISAACLPGYVQAESISLNIKDSSGADKFVVTDMGRVGIGTNAPGRAIQIVGPDVSTTQVLTQDVANGAIGGAGYLAYHNRGAVGAIALPSAGDRLGYYLFGAFDPIGGRGLNAAGITGKTDGTWSSDGGANYSVPAAILFETTDVPIPPATGSARTEKMRISGNGKVGIGTQAPTQQLEVNGGVRLNTVSTKPSCDTNAGGTLWFDNGSADDALWVCAKKGSVYAWKQIW